MAFKKKTKPKKSKKSSKKNRDTEWSFEGGVSYGNDQQEDPKEYKRIHTQERDERLRRGRLKIEDRKRKQYFANKMAKRVKFSDVWKADEQQTNPEQLEQLSLESVQSRQLNESNPLPVLDRLQFFLKTSLSQSSKSLLSGKHVSKGSLEMDVSDDDETNKVDLRQVTSNESENERDRLVFERKEQDDEAIEDHEVNDDEQDFTEQPSDAATDSNPYFSWYFQSKIISDREKATFIKELSSKKKIQQLEPIIFPFHHDKGLLYQAANKQLPEHNLPELDTVATIPGIHKLWKHTAPSPQLNHFSRQLLPQLLTHSDIFIEGRNYVNDKLMLETLLMHGVFHVVRSRTIVAKHNQRLKQKENQLKKKFQAANVLDLDKIASEGIENQDKKKKKKSKATKASSNQPENSSTNTLHERLDEVDLEEGEDETTMKDQGFVRPRLLILTPLRSTAKRVVQMIIQILGENTSISGLSKFQDEYSDLEASEEDNQSIDYGAQYYSQHLEDEQQLEMGRRAMGEKPEDWKALFSGNIDDDFKMGIQINPGHGKGRGATKGVYLRLFSDFYLSDFIIASPIGLKFVLDASSSSAKGASKNLNFLTSIEQVILHQFDVLSYQNLEHVHEIFQSLNQMPSESHESTDYSRVRPYFLNGLSAYYRQIMITSAFMTPELHSFFRQYAMSHAGWLRVKKQWPSNGMISQVLVPKVKQIFQILPIPSTASLSEDPAALGGKDDARDLLSLYEEKKFEFFKDKVLTKLQTLKQSRVLIVIPSYLDFIKIRNEMMKQEMNAAYISEYSRESEISRGRSRFYQGLKDILVYSGRAHFYRRFRIRGAKHIIFYSLPEYPHFYPELVNMLGDFRAAGAKEDEEEEMEDEEDDEEEENEGEGRKRKAQSKKKEVPAVTEIDTDEEYTSLALCSEVDQMALERVVGKKRCDQMLESKKTTFLFFS